MQAWSVVKFPSRPTRSQSLPSLLESRPGQACRLVDLSVTFELRE
jgi:hypothetical protein